MFVAILVLLIVTGCIRTFTAATWFDLSCGGVLLAAGVSFNALLCYGARQAPQVHEHFYGPQETEYELAEENGR